MLLRTITACTLLLPAIARGQTAAEPTAAPTPARTIGARKRSAFSAVWRSMPLLLLTC